MARGLREGTVVRHVVLSAWQEALHAQVFDRRPAPCVPDLLHGISQVAKFWVTSLRYLKVEKECGLSACCVGVDGKKED